MLEPRAGNNDDVYCLGSISPKSKNHPILSRVLFLLGMRRPVWVSLRVPFPQSSINNLSPPQDRRQVLLRQYTSTHHNYPKRQPNHQQKWSSPPWLLPSSAWLALSPRYFTSPSTPHFYDLTLTWTASRASRWRQQRYCEAMQPLEQGI